MSDRITIMPNNAFDEMGSWTAGGDATNVTTDTDEFKVQVGSVNFDIDVSVASENQATLANSTFTPQDLSTYEDSGRFRIWVFIPDVTFTNSVGFRWGSSSTVYWERTVVTDYKDQYFRDGWNLLEYNWGGDVTEVGSPTTSDAQSIAYLQVLFNYKSNQTDDTDYRLDAIILATTFDPNDVYAVTYFRRPAKLTNEMDELDVPDGYGSLLLEGVIANLMVRYENRDTLTREMLDRADEKHSKFISQASKRTRRSIGFRPYSRPRRYSNRSSRARRVNRNYDVYFPRD